MEADGNCTRKMGIDKRDIEILYERYARKLYFTALRITGKAEDAEEAMQDAFIKYYLQTRADKGAIETCVHEATGGATSCDSAAADHNGGASSSGDFPSQGGDDGRRDAVEHNRVILNIEAWLRRVCARNAVDILRSRSKNESLFSELPQTERARALERYEEEMLDPENAEKTGRNTVAAIKEALAHLPDGPRTILSLRLFEGYDYSEIARITGLKEVSVRSQFSRGKEKLRKLLAAGMEESTGS